MGIYLLITSDIKCFIQAVSVLDIYDIPDAHQWYYFTSKFTICFRNCRCTNAYAYVHSLVISSICCFIWSWKGSVAWVWHRTTIDLSYSSNDEWREVFVRPSTTSSSVRELDCVFLGWILRARAILLFSYCYQAAQILVVSSIENSGMVDGRWWAKNFSNTRAFSEAKTQCL